MQGFYIAVAQYLQKKLPLNNELIYDLTCLQPLSQKDDRRVCAIGRIARLIPQVISQDKVSLVQDEFRAYSQEDIPDTWYM